MATRRQWIKDRKLHHGKWYVFSQLQQQRSEMTPVGLSHG